MKRLLPWVIALLSFAAAPCLAHKQSDGYLTLSFDGVALQGQWDIALRDLEIAIGLDTNADGRITWGETRLRADAIRQYAFSRVRVMTLTGQNTRNCDLTPGGLLVDEHVDGAYAVLQFSGNCADRPEHVGIAYSLLTGIDPNHRGLLNLRVASAMQSGILPNDAKVTWLTLARPDRWQQLGAFVKEGIRHIWQGYDHILFLLTLLLPSVVIYRAGRWEPHASLRESAIDIVKVVSAFTLAHSLTLSLAALEIVKLPSRVVESAIALTVLLGALNILCPLVRERRWLLALLFGLVHGVGFASVLADLRSGSGHLLEALVGFNLGVELGQLVIVLLLMPVAFLIRGTFFYRRMMLPAGAAGIACLAIYWAVTRAFPAGLAAL